jgi:NCAIR mutase (PurE)-related protein
MDERHIREMLKGFKDGKINEEDIIKKLKKLPYEEIDYAKIDHHRSLRRGFGEVIYCAGKTPEQTAAIFEKMLEVRERVLGTRADEKTYETVREIAPDALYNKDARTITVTREEIPINSGKIVIATGGTSDIPVAEEAAVTAECMGNSVDRLYDVGVAGIHRLLMNTERIYSASVIIAVAGMEGALASVIGGLADCPIIAVPTSIGYGSNFNGLSALLTMLNSCSSGIGVVNIDNGY